MGGCAFSVNYTKSRRAVSWPSFLLLMIVMMVMMVMMIVMLLVEMTKYEYCLLDKTKISSKVRYLRIDRVNGVS